MNIFEMYLQVYTYIKLFNVGVLFLIVLNSSLLLVLPTKRPFEHVNCLYILHLFYHYFYRVLPSTGPKCANYSVWLFKCACDGVANCYIWTYIVRFKFNIDESTTAINKFLAATNGWKWGTTVSFLFDTVTNKVSKLLDVLLRRKISR